MRSLPAHAPCCRNPQGNDAATRAWALWTRSLQYLCKSDLGDLGPWFACVLYIAGASPPHTPPATSSLRVLGAAAAAGKRQQGARRYSIRDAVCAPPPHILGNRSRQATGRQAHSRGQNRARGGRIRVHIDAWVASGASSRAYRPAATAAAVAAAIVPPHARVACCSAPLTCGFVVWSHTGIWPLSTPLFRAAGRLCQAGSHRQLVELC